jgi:triacylglycerol lipase
MMAVLAILLAAWGAAYAPVTSSPARLDVPIVLVPGWFDTARELAALRIRLSAAGASHVETVTFREPTGGNRDHAEEIDSVVSQVLAETGADQVDIVAHSMGGLATRWFLKTHPEAPVRRVVFIASPHRGTLSAHLAWGEGRDEMMPDSPFLQSLNSGDPVPAGIEAMTIRTPIDTRVVPGESATLPGVEDHTVCCPTHQGLLRHEDVFVLVLDFLERTGSAIGSR